MINVMGVCWKINARYEVREDAQTGERTRFFVIQRKNSAAISNEMKWFIDQMREVGVKTVVEVGVNEITPEQFEQRGIWAGKSSQTVIRPQGVYNVRSRIRQIESVLADITVDDPRREELLEVRQKLKAMLDTTPLLETETEREQRTELDRSMDRLMGLKTLLEDAEDRVNTKGDNNNARKSDVDGEDSTTR